MLQAEVQQMQRAFGLAEGAPCFFDHTAFGMRPVDMGVAFHIVSVADVRVLKQLLSKPVAYFERQIERRQRGANAGRINDLLRISDDDDHDGHDGDYGDDDCMSRAQHWRNEGILNNQRGEFAWALLHETRKSRFTGSSRHIDGFH